MSLAPCGGVQGYQIIFTSGRRNYGQSKAVIYEDVGNNKSLYQDTALQRFSYSKPRQNQFSYC